MNRHKDLTYLNEVLVHPLGEGLLLDGIALICGG